MNLFGTLELLLARLYPYRVPLALLLAAVTVAAVVIAARRGLLERGWRAAVRRPVRSLAVAAAITAVAVPLGLYLLSPLWTRSMLDESAPAAAAGALASPGASAPSTARPAPAEAAPRTVLTGDWRGADEFHFARGRALVIETAPGRYTLRVEQFSVRNGPDLFIYLSPSANGYAKGAINLGMLKATDGSLNYEIPAGTRLDEIRSAVVWCRQFTVQFGHAPFSS